MDTDYAAPADVDRIRARVLKVVETERSPEERQTWVREFPVTTEPEVTPSAYALPATFGVLPNDGDIDREIVIELEALENASDQVSRITACENRLRAERDSPDPYAPLSGLRDAELLGRRDLWLRRSGFLQRALLHR